MKHGKINGDRGFELENPSFSFLDLSPSLRAHDAPLLSYLVNENGLK